MLLAPGPLQRDATAPTVVVGLADGPGRLDVARVAPGADVVWLGRPATAAQVQEVAARSGRPVGITLDGPAPLAELRAAGAVAVELGAGDVDLPEVVAVDGLGLWCGPATARRALDAGLAPDRLIVEGGPWTGPGETGATVPGAGPSAWGAALRAVLGGAGVVRTTDVRALRRVVAVTDRLVAARREGGSR